MIGRLGRGADRTMLGMKDERDDYTLFHIYPHRDAEFMEWMRFTRFFAKLRKHLVFALDGVP